MLFIQKSTLKLASVWWVVALCSSCLFAEDADLFKESNDLPVLIQAQAKNATSCPDYNPFGNPYFGDTHGHTAWSFDARAFGNTSILPDQAIAFAKGEEINHPLGGRARLDKALDFVAISDHAEFFDLLGACTEDPENSLYEQPFCARLRAEPQFGLLMITELNFDITPPIPADPQALEQGRKLLWRKIVNMANAADDPCQFSTFPAYEWTGGTSSGEAERGNLHRNILYVGNNLPDEAWDARRFSHESELWGKLQTQCRDLTDCDALVIPHNSNMSKNGAMWTLENPAQAQMRKDFEPIVEIFQHKGDSECSNAGLDPTDLAWDKECDFEKLTFQSIPDAGLSMNFSGAEQDRSGMARQGLAAGLAYQEKEGMNPLAFGMIASTDDHNGTPGLVAEESYQGHHGTFWEGDEKTRIAEARDRGAGGLAVIWAKANTRQELFDAMMRREVYGTSGPRIVLRYWAAAPGTDWCALGEKLPQKMAEAGAIPMGSEWKGASPLFVIKATADRVPLTEVQLVRIRSDDKKTTPDSRVFSAAVTSGSSEMCIQWQDPDWRPDRPAAYYTRVLEQPTPRWTWFACQRYPDLCKYKPGEMVRERAWSSPVWTGG